MKKNYFIFVFILFAFHFVIQAQNINIPKSQKKTTPFQNALLEFNPLLMVNQGLGVNGEFLLNNRLSLGTSFEIYTQEPYNLMGVKATRFIINVAPFLRYYFLADSMLGFFVGGKLNFTSSVAKIIDSEYLIASHRFYVAPSVHVGYRFSIDKQWVLSAYAGLGVKSSSNEFPLSEIPEDRKNNRLWLDAHSRLNYHTTSLQPDFGFTVGYVF